MPKKGAYKFISSMKKEKNTFFSKIFTGVIENHSNNRIKSQNYQIWYFKSLKGFGADFFFHVRKNKYHIRNQRIKFYLVQLQGC